MSGQIAQTVPARICMPCGLIHSYNISFLRFVFECQACWDLQRFSLNLSEDSQAAEEITRDLNMYCHTVDAHFSDSTTTHRALCIVG